MIPLCRACHRRQHSGGWFAVLESGPLKAECVAYEVAGLVMSHACDDYPETPRTRDGRSVMGTRCAICLRAIEEPSA